MLLVMMMMMAVVTMWSLDVGASEVKSGAEYIDDVVYPDALGGLIHKLFTPRCWCNQFAIVRTAHRVLHSVLQKCVPAWFDRLRFFVL